jgi:hypothetical protein
MVYQTFPSLSVQAWSSFKEPFWHTRMQRGPNVREKRVQDQPVPLWQWEVKYDILRDTWDQRGVPSGLGNGYDELRTLAGFYLQQQGSLIPFLYIDPTDNTITSQALGTGDGVTTKFTIGRNMFNYFEPMYYVTNVANVYLNNVLQPAVGTWDLTSPYEPGAFINFGTPPGEGVIVSIDFSYAWLVRFSDNSLGFENFMVQLWQNNSVKFRQTRPSQSVIAVQPGLSCVSELNFADSNIIWDLPYSPVPYKTLTAPVQDVNGVFYANYQQTVVTVSPTGPVATINYAQLCDSIDTWFGSAIVNRWTGGYDIYIQPSNSGEYLIAWTRGTNAVLPGFEDWIAVLAPSVAGGVEVLGAIRYSVGPIGPPYANYLIKIYESGIKSNNDPLIAFATEALGTSYSTIMVLPSIGTILSGTYKLTGFGGSFNLPCWVPNVYYEELSPLNLGAGLFLTQLYWGISRTNLMDAFTLPNTNNGTNIYLYFNRALMDYTLAAIGTPEQGITDVEIQNVLQPAYSKGCIIRIELANNQINWVDLANEMTSSYFPQGLPAPAAYVVDNNNWINSNNQPQIPFTDEYTYVSNGISGGVDTYIMRPVATINKGNGTWWVIFVMPNVSDSVANLNGQYLTFTMRVFSYNAATQIATQIYYTFCRTWTGVQVPIFDQPLPWNNFSIGGNVNGSEVNLFGVFNGNDYVAFTEQFGALI